MSSIKLQSEYKDLDKYDQYGYTCYYKKNTKLYHNPYGPAVISKSGYKEYYIEDRLHRLDGPAMIYSNDEGQGAYYINNKRLTKKQFETHPERLKYLGKEHLICVG